MLPYPPRLDATSKEEIANYFVQTFEFFESLFELLKPEAFYIQSEPTRHIMLFYFGHTAVFYINKLFAQGLIPKRINPEFESLFAVGVDEMEWDNVDATSYAWPKINQVQAYRQEVKQRVLEFIHQTPLTLPITWENPFWIVMMAIEHERIHIETSSVLHRQMPLAYIKEQKRYTPQFKSKKPPKNEMLFVAATTVKLGKTHDDCYYGWDNEYGAKEVKLQSFEVSKYLVSNAEFLEFVADGGYDKEEFWDEEGRAFLQKSGAKHPCFWVAQQDGSFLYRSYDRLIPLPLNLPVEVNALEAEAFLRYKSKKANKHYQLPSEEEYMALWEAAKLGEVVTHHEANVNFAYGFGSVEVDRFDQNGLFDLCGNVWCWSRTPIDGFSGFSVHPAYDDFSTPTFDNKHYLILGSSWASSGNLLLKRSRYAFRKHFFQHAGFRYVLSNNQTTTIDPFLEEDTEVVEWLIKEYIQNHFDALTQKALSFAKKSTKALVMGCKCGKSAFFVAKEFEHVDGCDITARFLKAATTLKTRNYIKYKTDSKVRLLEFDTSSVTKKVHFIQADPKNLKAELGGYDFVLDLSNEASFLEQISTRLNPDAIIATTRSIQNLQGFKTVFTDSSLTVFQKEGHL